MKDYVGLLSLYEILWFFRFYYYSLFRFLYLLIFVISFYYSLWLIIISLVCVMLCYYFHLSYPISFYFFLFIFLFFNFILFFSFVFLFIFYFYFSVLRVSYYSILFFILCFTGGEYTLWGMRATCNRRLYGEVIECRRERSNEV